MTTFFLDLWHDLREKRLWPVAVGLLAAAVAIPVVMLKPAGEPPAPAVVAENGERETLPALNLDSTPASSKLQTFSQRNPFKPLEQLEDGTDADSGGSSSGSTPGGSSSAAASGAGSSSGSASAAGGPSGGASGGGGSSTPPGIDPNGPRVQWFRYTADIEFGTPSRAKRMKGVQSLTLLPDERNPVVVFMGVSDDAKSAVFFVADPGFTPEGEGECNNEDNCRFVKLSLDEDSNEESFTASNGGAQYDLKLLKLKRENVSAAEAKGDAEDAKSKEPAGSTIGKANDDFLAHLPGLPGLARQKK